MQSFLLHGFLETLPHMALISLQVYLLTYLLTYLLIYLFIYLFILPEIIVAPVFAHPSGQGGSSRRR